MLASATHIVRTVTFAWYIPFIIPVEPEYGIHMKPAARQSTLGIFCLM